MYEEERKKRRKKEKKGEENINTINIRMSQKYVEIANLFEREKRGRK